MAQQQTTLNDSTEVRTERKAESDADVEAYFGPRRRKQLRAAGVDPETAARVEQKLDGGGRWWPANRTEQEKRYIEVRGSEELYLPASDMADLRGRGGLL